MVRCQDENGITRPRGVRSRYGPHFRCPKPLSPFARNRGPATLPAARYRYRDWPQLHVKQAIYMATSFQAAGLIKLRWHTEMTRNREKAKKGI